MHWTGAYDGFGTGSLDRDRMEMGCLVKYLREQGRSYLHHLSAEYAEDEVGLKRIVLMGHSTGSQDVIHYLSRSPSSLSTSKSSTSTSALSPDSLPEVDGGIMQAPASDREYFLHSTTEDGVLWSGQVPFATELVESGRGAEILGEEFCEKADVGINAYRLWSLLAEG